MTIEDLIIQAGGLLEAAATTRVSVTRRIKNPSSTTFSSELGKTFLFDIKDGLVVDGEKFALEPFDEVYIRTSPTYRRQQNVTISGEVLFGGSYSLLQKNERLSDLVKRAGGVTPDAYVKGARLVRQVTPEERLRERDALRMAHSGSGKDSISVERLAIATDSYSVGINLEEALANPYSDYDLVLREGDVLYIPEYVNTVKISGAVMYPNTVLYQDGKNLRHYINQAGGYANLAKKKKAYVVYMNGTVSRLKASNSDAIEPGCLIIVPSREEKKRMSVAELMGIGTTTASIAAMVATIVNLVK